MAVSLVVFGVVPEEFCGLAQLFRSSNPRGLSGHDPAGAEHPGEFVDCVWHFEPGEPMRERR